MRIVPNQSSWKMSLGWWDLSQGEGEGNWWPGGGRWRLGAVMKDATVLFPEGEVLCVGDERAKL